MKRVILSDGNVVFNYRHKKREKKLVSIAYKKIDGNYWDFADDQKRIYHLGLKARGKISDVASINAVQLAIKDVALFKSWCAIEDPYKNDSDDYTDRWVVSLDVIWLYRFLCRLMSMEYYFLCTRHLLSTQVEAPLITVSDTADQTFQRAVKDIHLEIINKVLQLYRSLLEIFCKLCSGDTFFAKALKDLNKAGGHWAISANKKGA